MVEYEHFKLPDQYEGKTIIARQELGRLTIGGCLDLSIWCGKGEWRWPAPLILLDGEGVTPRKQMGEVGRQHFYGPMLQTKSGVWELNDTEWAFIVDVPNNGDRPFSYLGHGIEPSNAVADIFDQPIPYDQEAFDEKAGEFLNKLESNDAVGS